jgi:DNA recombination protein RmuC
MNTAIIVIAILALVLMAVTAVLTFSVRNIATTAKNNTQTVSAQVQSNSEQLQTANLQIQQTAAMLQAYRQETDAQIDGLLRQINEIVGGNQKSISELQDRRLQDMSSKLNNLSIENEQKLDNIRKTMEGNLNRLREDNTKQLNEMRKTVDEKLQETLETRITKSFELVNTRLQEVYTGLGEMKDLASGVGDLKKVLSNVKTRGILGEVQLGAILNQILSPDQYEENVETVPGSGRRVEFAIKLPGDDDGSVYLPIDSKFPMDAYMHLTAAQESGERAAVDEAKKNLANSIKAFAKDIHEKYISIPYTTDFGIMFLPTEGLYAEAVNLGLVEELQNKFKINLAGPTTMAALLNSLQMGFKTLAIQKHSSEVWETLGAVKTEFGKFGDVLTATQTKLNKANEDLEKLIGTRTNSIMRKLRSVESLNEFDSRNILELDEFGFGDYDDPSDE